MISGSATYIAVTDRTGRRRSKWKVFYAPKNLIYFNDRLRPDENSKNWNAHAGRAGASTMAHGLTTARDWTDMGTHDKGERNRRPPGNWKRAFRPMQGSSGSRGRRRVRAATMRRVRGAAAGARRPNWNVGGGGHQQLLSSPPQRRWLWRRAVIM